jgi:hypothetical protein
MKQKDIALIVVIAAVSGVLSFFISDMIFVTPDNRQQAVEKVDVITADFTPPSEKYFNNQSVNPAQSVQIGGGNQNPFAGAQ